MDLIDQLLPELVEKVFSYLSARDLSSASRCCLRWREFTNKDTFWLHFCMLKGWLKYGLNTDLINEKSLNVKMTNVGGNSPVFQLFVSEGTRLSPLCKWKSIFIRVHHLNKNWSKGRYSVAPVLKGHREKVTALQSNGRFIVSGSEDKSLRLWEITNGECIRKLDGHMDTINCIIWKGNTIITGCADAGVRLIDSTTFTILFSLQGHTSSVDHMTLVGKVLVTASSDRTIRCWYLPDRRMIQIMRGHEDDIECMCSYGTHVVTGSWDKTLILWDIDRGEAVHQFEGHTEAVTCCHFDEDRIISGSFDSTVRIWKISPFKCQGVLTGHTAEVYCLVANEHVIASGSADSTVRLWSKIDMCACPVPHNQTYVMVNMSADPVAMMSGQLVGSKALHVLQGHLGVVRCLHINDERLVSGGDQQKVIVWDYRTGKLLNVVHRHPSLLHIMWVSDTKLITASPERPGTIALLSYW